jgi:hypothetical protein
MTNDIKQAHHPSYLYQGGGDYRGIYDIGFKKGFMGYIGLLLNDPYKRDRIDGCMLDIFLFLLFVFCCAALPPGAARTKVKMGYSGV